jgi:hypothetical protein
METAMDSTKTSTRESVSADALRAIDTPPPAADQDEKDEGDGVQGEGNYEAARVFNEAERKFVASGMVDAAARAAAPTSDAERLEMIAAEEEGKRRAKGEDPALTELGPDSVAP